MCSRDKILERLKKFKEKIEAIGGDTEKFVFERPAKEEEILIVEEELGLPLPQELRKAFLELSSHIEFEWDIDEEEADISFPEEFRDSLSGSLNFGLDLLTSLAEELEDWREDCFSDEEDSYDKIFYNKLAFQEVGNGDFLAIDLNRDSYGKVVYLSHEGSDLHGYVMADSFSDFIEEYSKLGCVGAGDWQWEIFTQGGGPIDSQCSKGKKWRRLILQGEADL